MGVTCSDANVRINWWLWKPTQRTLMCVCMYCAPCTITGAAAFGYKLYSISCWWPISAGIRKCRYERHQCARCSCAARIYCTTVQSETIYSPLQDGRRVAHSAQYSMCRQRMAALFACVVREHPNSTTCTCLHINFVPHLPTRSGGNASGDAWRCTCARTASRADCSPRRHAARMRAARGAGAATWRAGRDGSLDSIDGGVWRCVTSSVTEL